MLEVQSWMTGCRDFRMLWHQALHRQSAGELLLTRAEITDAFTLADGHPVCLLPAMQALREAPQVPEAAWSFPPRHSPPAS